MFPDPFACPGCRSKLRRDPALLPGTPVRCPRCGRDFALPAEAPPVPRLPPPMLVPPSRQAPPPGQRDPAWRYDGREVERRGIDDLDGASYSVEINHWFAESTRHWVAMARVFTAHVLLCGLLGAVLIGLFSFFGGFVAALLALPLAQGPMAIALAMIQRRHWRFRQLFTGFVLLPAFLGFYAVIGLLSLACIVPVALAADLLGGMRLDPVVEMALTFGACSGSLALLSLVHARLATFGPQLILDRGCGPLAAIRGCWRLSRGHFWGLCGFNLLLWTINVTGLLLCYVGLLATLPLTQLAAAAAYLHAVGQLPGHAAPPRHGPDED